jgi:hypothetical protein
MQIEDFGRTRFLVDRLYYTSRSINVRFSRLKRIFNVVAVKFSLGGVLLLTKRRCGMMDVGRGSKRSKRKVGLQVTARGVGESRKKVSKRVKWIDRENRVRVVRNAPFG